jgi:hypothetical protein
METLSNDLLRLILAKYLPISNIGILARVSVRFVPLSTDESLFGSIARQYSPSLTSETKRSYTWKQIVQVIHYYQVKFSKTVHCRYGLAFGPDKVKLLNTEANIFTSFDYRGFMLDPGSIGKEYIVKLGHAKYSQRVDILHFAEPKHNFFTAPVEKMQPLYRACLTNKVKKKLPPVEAFSTVAYSDSLEDMHKVGGYNDYVAQEVRLGKPDGEFLPGRCSILARPGIVLFDARDPVIAWNVDHFRKWIDTMTHDCHNEMQRLYQTANLAYAQTLYYKITDADNQSIVMQKRGGDMKEFLMMAFRSSKSRLKSFRKLEIIQDNNTGELFLKAYCTLDFLPIRKTNGLARWTTYNWSPIELCPIIREDGSWTSKLTKEKREEYHILHPYDYFYGLEVHGQRYRQVIKLEIAEQFRRHNKLPAIVLFTPKLDLV